MLKDESMMDNADRSAYLSAYKGLFVFLKATPFIEIFTMIPLLGRGIHMDERYGRVEGLLLRFLMKIQFSIVMVEEEMIFSGGRKGILREMNLASTRSTTVKI